MDAKEPEAPLTPDPPQLASAQELALLRAEMADLRSAITVLRASYMRLIADIPLRFAEQNARLKGMADRLCRDTRDVKDEVVELLAVIAEKDREEAERRLKT